MNAISEKAGLTLRVKERTKLFDVRTIVDIICLVGRVCHHSHGTKKDMPGTNQRHADRVENIARYH